MQWPWIAFQFAVSMLAGGWALVDFKATMGAETSGALFTATIVGLIAARAAMFLVVWARFGWRSARSMSMSL